MSNKYETNYCVLDTKTGMRYGDFNSQYEAEKWAEEHLGNYYTVQESYGDRK